MADIPEGARLIDNPVSGAPGFQVENVYVLPGVPRIMQAMFDGISATLAGGEPVLSVSVATNLGESALATELARMQSANMDVRHRQLSLFQARSVRRQSGAAQ